MVCGPNFKTINDVLFEIVSGIVSDFETKKQKFTKKDICEAIEQSYMILSEKTPRLALGMNQTLNLIEDEMKYNKLFKK